MSNVGGSGYKITQLLGVFRSMESTETAIKLLEGWCRNEIMPHLVDYDICV